MGPSVGGLVRRTVELMPVEASIGCGFAKCAKGGVGRTKCYIFVEGGRGCDLAHPSSGGGALPGEGAGHCG